MKILYITDKTVFGYYKISAVKPNDFEYGEGELNTEVFGIITAPMSAAQIKDWQNLNKWCVNDNLDGITETKEEDRIKPAALPEKMPEPEAPKKLYTLENK